MQNRIITIEKVHYTHTNTHTHILYSTSTTSRSACTSMFVHNQVTTTCDMCDVPLDAVHYEIAHIPHTITLVVPTRDKNPIPIALLVGVGLGVPEQHSIWYVSRTALHVPLTEALNSTCRHDDVDRVAARSFCCGFGRSMPSPHMRQVSADVTGLLQPQ